MSAGLMKSKFVHSSVVSPSSVASIISEPIGWLSLKFWFLLPLGHMTVRVLKKKKRFLRIFFVFVRERAQITKGHSSLKSLFESFETFPEFSSQESPQKYCFGFLKFWVYDVSQLLALLDYVSKAHKIEICPSSVVWNQNLSVVRLPLSVSQLSQNILSKFLSNFTCGFPWDIPQTFLEFLKNTGPFGSQNFKMLLLPQITFSILSHFF